MKRTLKTAALALAAILICGALSAVSFAKDLEECYHCGATGEYHCPQCGNAGTVVCDGCGGAGNSVCPGEEDKGPCQNGYYTCPSCKGTGYAIKENGEVDTDVRCGYNRCVNGKVECWHCHGKYILTCDRCNGTGRSECQEGNCKESRKIGWKCHYCMGAGYLLTNNWPGQNDGVQNRPVKGDKIWDRTTGKSVTYGGESGGSGGNGGESGGSGGSGGGNGGSGGGQEDPGPAQDPVDPVEGVLPPNRSEDFEIPLAPSPDGQKPARATVETERMTAEEREYYAALPEEELSQILGNVKKIVETVEAGRSDGETDKLLEQIARKNGFESLVDGRLYPISFEGHQGIGFPVRVTVPVREGDLPGGCDLYVYHVMPNGEIESLGRAEYWTHPDGSVESITFYTTGFSSFFTAKNELDLDLSKLPGDGPGDPLVVDIAPPPAGASDETPTGYNFLARFVPASLRSSFSGLLTLSGAGLIAATAAIFAVPLALIAAAVAIPAAVSKKKKKASADPPREDPRM